jgi:hypothetical protein
MRTNGLRSYSTGRCIVKTYTMCDVRKLNSSRGKGKCMGEMRDLRSHTFIINH